MQECHPDIATILISAEEIAAAIEKLGKRMRLDYAGKTPLVIGILKGAFLFMADLVREMNVDCDIDFMAVSSYGAGMKSTGNVKVLKDVSTSLVDRHIILVEDIVDTGLTLSHLSSMLEKSGAASVEIASFAVKDIPGRLPRVDPKYYCFHVPNEFVVGYGLDYAGRYRNLPYVGVLKPEVYLPVEDARL